MTSVMQVFTGLQAVLSSDPSGGFRGAVVPFSGSCEGVWALCFRAHRGCGPAILGAATGSGEAKILSKLDRPKTIHC